LGDTFTAYTLGGMTPVNLVGGARRSMLEPLDERRAELAGFLQTHPASVRLRFTKTALCLIPGNEHRSLEVQYRLSAARIRHNLYDATTMVDDDQTVSATHDFDEGLRQNPYRWVCRACSLVRLCRSARTAWYAPNFLPTRDQKPHPILDTSPADVLARWREIEPDRADGVDLAAVSAPVAGETPEERLLAVLRAARPGEPVLSDAWLDGRRFLDVELHADDRELHLHLGLVTEPRRDLGFVVSYLDVVPALHGARRADLLAVLERLAGGDLPSFDDWGPERGLQLDRARVLLAAWTRLGRRLWPGHELTGGFVTAGARLAGDTLGVTAMAPDGARLDVSYTPVFHGRAHDLQREILMAQRPDAPADSPLDPAVRAELSGLFPAASTTLRGPAGWNGRVFDLVAVHEVRHG
jgi:hypothetical protein